MVATSYASGDKFFIDPFKLLPMDRFFPKAKGAVGASAGGRGADSLEMLFGFFATKVKHKLLEGAIKGGSLRPCSLSSCARANISPP